MADEVRTGEATWHGYRLVYEELGEGPRTFVFIRGLLLDASLNRQIARALAQRGFRVILPELLGHGRSDRPTHAYEHRLEFEAEQVLAVMDELGIEETVIGGTSLGANVTLQVAAMAPDRVRAMVVEMPVLERGGVAATAVFFPLLLALRYARPVPLAIAAIARRVPRPPMEALTAFLNTLSRPPRDSAAVLHGLMSGPLTPSARDRKQLKMPTLVIGHRGDLLHPMNDAEALAAELEDAELFTAWSIAEARTFPKRVSDRIAAFLEKQWAPRLATAPASEA